MSSTTSTTVDTSSLGELSDEELVDAYTDAAGAPAGDYSIADYDAIVQEMADRFETNVHESSESNE